MGCHSKRQIRTFDICHPQRLHSLMWEGRDGPLVEVCVIGPPVYVDWWWMKDLRETESLLVEVSIIGPPVYVDWWWMKDLWETEGLLVEVSILGPPVYVDWWWMKDLWETASASRMIVDPCWKVGNIGADEVFVKGLPGLPDEMCGRLLRLHKTILRNV